MSASSHHHPLFPLGQLVATPGAIALLQELNRSPVEFISRHLMGDWGDLCPDDIKANQDALHHGTRLFSSYVINTHQKLWVITEADRSVTTLLLPEEY